MAVPYTFATLPNGSSIPLSYLDANFSYLEASPSFSGNVSISGTLSVAGAAAFSSTLSASSLTLTTQLSAANGGTGQSSYTIGDILYASGSTALSRLADVATGNALISGGFGVAPSWGKVGLDTHVSGTLPVANGGTDLSSYTVGDILYASGTTALSRLADVAAGNALISGGVNSAPLWGKIGLTTHVSGTLPVANGGTGSSAAGIAAFNNITGYTASGATGTTSTDLVFSSSPTLTTPTFATSFTSPLHIGGTGASSSLTLRSTSGSGSSGADIIFQTGNNGSTEAMRILNNGDVGVGTATPSFKFDIISSSTTVANVCRIFNGGATSGTYAGFKAGTGEGISCNFYATAATGWIGTESNHPLVFLSNNTERMRFDTSGNVLIGTTTSPTTGTKCLTIETGTAATASPSDTITIYSTDLSAGNTIPSFYCEGTGVTGAGITNVTVTHKIAIRVNGTVYYLLATTNAT